MQMDVGPRGIPGRAGIGQKLMPSRPGPVRMLGLVWLFTAGMVGFGRATREYTSDFQVVGDCVTG